MADGAGIAGAARAPEDEPFLPDHEHFLGAAARHPERVAVVVATDDGPRRTSYGALRDGARRVAVAVAPLAPSEGPVAIVAPVDERAIAAMIGIHLAGRVLTNFNRADPAAHVALLARMCGAALFLCTNETEALVKEAADLAGGTTVVDLDAVLAGPPAPSSFVPQAVVKGQLSTIHYTSGSTGAPKGTAAWHGASFTAAWPPAPVLEDECPLFLDGLLAPAVINSSYRSFAVGACVALYDLRTRGGAGLPRWIDDAKTTRLRGQTSMLRLLLQAVEPSADRRLASMRLVSVGGERLDLGDIARFAAAFPPGSRLEHLYGFNEAKAVVAAWAFTVGDPVPSSAPPFRPNPAFQVRFVDADGEPLAPGEVGELVVRSRLLAHGYEGQPELTAQRFTSHDDGTTSFRTGDLGRLLDGGAFELLGRADDQVKVRGFNVQLGTVEAALTALPGIRQAAVAPVPRPDGGVVLVAYVVAETEYRPTVGELRRGLAATLTPASVPSSFHLVPGLPTGSSGKVDRALLTRTSARLVPHDVERVAPRGDAERRVHHVVATVLGLDAEAFGVLDDLFDLGADSLSIQELLARLRDEAGAAVELPDLLGAASVAGLTALVAPASGSERNGAGARSAPPLLVPLRVPASAGPAAVPIVLFGGGVEPGLSMVRLGRRLGEHHPVLVAQQPSRDGHVRPFRTVRAFAAAAEAEVRRLVPSGPCVLAGHSFGGLVAYATACRLREAGADVAAVLLLDTGVPHGGRACFHAARDRVTALRPARRTAGRGATRTGDQAATPPREHGAQRARRTSPPAAMQPDRWRTAWEPVDRAARRVGAAAVRRARHVVVHRLGLGTPTAADDAYALALATRVGATRFRPETYGGRVVVFRADVRRPHQRQDPPDLGWGRVAPATESVPVPSHHAGMVAEPDVATLADLVEAALVRPASP